MNLGQFNYWICVILLMVGLYAVIAKGNLGKKIMGLAIFQTGIFIFYISLGVIDGSTAPIFHDVAHLAAKPYSNPLPHVLILTAIVVSVSTMAVALAIVINIKRAYDTIEADEILELEQQQE
jgi:multicomponent Na+:H+ antiporter subunit C